MARHADLEVTRRRQDTHNQVIRFLLSRSQLPLLLLLLLVLPLLLLVLLLLFFLLHRRHAGPLRRGLHIAVDNPGEFLRGHGLEPLAGGDARVLIHLCQADVYSVCDPSLERDALRSCLQDEGQNWSRSASTLRWRRPAWYHHVSPLSGHGKATHESLSGLCALRAASGATLGITRPHPWDPKHPRSMVVTCSPDTNN